MELCKVRAFSEAVGFPRSKLVFQLGQFFIWSNRSLEVPLALCGRVGGCVDGRDLIFTQQEVTVRCARRTLFQPRRKVEVVPKVETPRLSWV